MCIRDSGCTVAAVAPPPLEATMEFVIALMRSLALLAWCEKMVNREATWPIWIIRAAIASVATSPTMETAASDSVSYTHLDVYKRQVVICVAVLFHAFRPIIIRLNPILRRKDRMQDPAAILYAVLRSSLTTYTSLKLSLIHISKLRPKDTKITYRLLQLPKTYA